MTLQKIGRYEIKAELGRGGMATVYRGYDPRFKREVAVKILPREFLHDPNFRARFEREAEVIAALEHPAIVPVYDYGEEEGQPYIIMRLMAGGSLADRLERGPLPLAETAHIFSRLAPALDRAHSRGIIHRDLKPGNILFDDDGNPYISDFGIAKLTEGGATFTGSGVVGTPAYMSPEQARGEKQIDGRSDIYALGAIVFQMLTGKFPYEADTPMGVIVKHITDPVPHILDANADLPAGCEDLIQKAMAKRPADRFPRAVEMAHTLGAISTGNYASAVTPPTLQAARVIIDTATQVQHTAKDSEQPKQERRRGEAGQAANAVAPAGPARVEKVTAAPPPKRQFPVEAAARPTIAAPRAAEAPSKKNAPNTVLTIGGVAAVILCVGGAGAIALLGGAFNPARQSSATAPTASRVSTVITTGAGQQIAFVSMRDGNSEIYTMRLDGSELTRITNNAAEDLSPAWAPNGNLAFVSTRDGNYEIYINDSVGLTRITNNAAQDLFPDWSADGSRLAFASDRDGNFEIYISDSSGLTRVTNAAADDLYPAWSRDGKLAFASNRDGNFEIYISDSSGLTRVTNNPADDLYPAWSADGGTLAFASNRDGNIDIFINDSDGLTRLTEDMADDTEPAWHP